MIDRLDAATLSLTKLALTYRDADDNPSQRIVRPLGLTFWGKVWTLIAWCELRDDFRMFRIDRIEEVSDAGPFRPEPSKTLPAFFRQESCRPSGRSA